MGAKLRRGWYVLVPALAALILGLWGLGTPAVWLDERFTIEAVSDGLSSHLWDAPMLPYYALMWVWTGGGSAIDIAWLRLPSVLAVAAAAALVAATARRLSTERAGLAAGLFLAIAPGVARYGQEARTYALAMCLVSAATWALVTAMTGGRRRAWIGYGVAMGIATLIIPASLAALPIHLVVLTGFPDWRAQVRDWVAACLFLVPVVALEVVAALVFTGTRTWLETPGAIDLVAGATVIANSEYTGVAGSVVAGGLVLVAAMSRTGLRWLAGCGLAVFLVWVVSVTVSSWWLPRTFIPLAGILCVAAGVSLARVAWPQVVVIVGVVALVSVPAHRGIRDPGSRGADPREIAAILDREGQAGDTVTGAPPGSPPWTTAQELLPTWAVAHYLRGDERFVVTGDAPAGRYWEFSAEASCPDFREWTVAGDVRRLRLCL